MDQILVKFLKDVEDGFHQLSAIKSLLIELSVFSEEFKIV